MTSVKTTIKNIQMRMNGINEGIEQLKQTTFTDIVRVEYFFFWRILNLMEMKKTI